MPREELRREAKVVFDRMMETPLFTPKRKRLASLHVELSLLADELEAKGGPTHER